MVRRATLEMAFTPGRTNDGKTIERRIEKQTGSYGFGWSIGSFEGNLTLEHAGVWSGYFNYIMRVPSRQITAVVLTNSSNDKMVAIAHKMIELAANEGPRFSPSQGVLGSYSGPEVLVLYRKREWAKCMHVHGVFARFRYSDLKEAPAFAADAGPMGD